MKYGYSEIGWKAWDENENSRESKIHICKDDAEKCLCGVTIPTDYSVEVGAGCDYGYGHCKKCEKAYNKI